MSSKGSGADPGQESSNFPHTTGGVRESVADTLFLTFNLVVFDYRIINP